jgi:hypothetical protein
MNEAGLLAAFVGAVVFIFLLYQSISWNSGWRTSSPHVLMNVTTQPGHIHGVEQEQRVFCPRRAQEVLSQFVLHQHMRGVLFRDGSVWVVSAGKELTVTRLPNGSSNLILYYMRQRPPQIIDETDPQPVTDAAPRPVDVPNMVPVRNSAISTAALVSTTPVTRYSSLTAALESFPVTDATDERTYLLTNGPTDPSYYIVRTRKEVTNAVITAPGLPGTVYTRKT